MTLILKLFSGIFAFAFVLLVCLALYDAYSNDFIVSIYTGLIACVCFLFMVGFAYVAAR